MNLIFDRYLIDEAIEAINNILQPECTYTVDHLLKDCIEGKVDLFSEYKTPNHIHFIASNNGYHECSERFSGIHYHEDAGDTILIDFDKNHPRLIKDEDLMFCLSGGDLSIREVEAIKNHNDDVALTLLGEGCRAGSQEILEYDRIELLETFSMKEKEKILSTVKNEGWDVELKEMDGDGTRTRISKWLRRLLYSHCMTSGEFSPIVGYRLLLNNNLSLWRAIKTGQIKEFFIKQVIRLSECIYRPKYYMPINGKFWANQDIDSMTTRASDIFIPKFELERYIADLKSPKSHIEKQDKSTQKTVPVKRDTKSQRKRILEELEERELTVGNRPKRGVLADIKKIIHEASGKTIAIATVQDRFDEMGIKSAFDTTKK